ncbi:MAG: CARDB domain-containing protein [Chloroflexota bacterium]
MFQLFYERQNSDGTIDQVQLARYTGQVGDGLRDSGDHETDLRWVTPGGAQSPDQPTFVPVDPGTPINPATGQPYTFELVLDRDLPNIVVDPITGDRIVHLYVTSLLPGYSKNTYALWAGPDDDAAAVPGDVNTRNLHVLNNPGSHNAHGVTILANRALPVQTLSNQGLDVPLAYMGPEYAGLTVFLSVFDLDTGSLPPINFYLDTLAYTPDNSANGFDETKTDWAVAHGYTGDPAGGCFANPYNERCNDTWVTYAITLPSDIECDGSLTNDCTPFYGGRFMARIQGGSEDELEYDAFTWSMWTSPDFVPPDWDITLGCSAFPIGVDEAIRSVLAPNDPSTAQNQWREDFDYPIPGVDYYAYPAHQPNTPLLNAKPGYLYNIQNGASSGGNGWLVWNQCIVADSSALVDSLTWPGNSKDYTPSGGQCVVNGETMPRFPGFMEVGDNTDKSMHTGDWVAVNMGSTSSNSLVDIMEEHVDLDRTLRVIVYDDINSYSYAYRIKRFALMRLLGFSLNQGAGESFILAEFIGWDNSCAQEGVFIDEITLTGPTAGTLNTNYAFTTIVSPSNVTPPLTITWSATDASSVTQTNTLKSVQSFQWSTSGLKTITVTAQNQGSDLITATHQIAVLAPLDLVIGPMELVTPLPITAGQPVTFHTTVTNTGDVDLNSQVFVDLFINPTEIHDEYIPVGQSSGSASLSGLAAQSSQVVTLTAVSGFPLTPTTHTVYAMVDSLQAVNEADETNNISPPLFVSGILPPPQPPLSVTLSGPSVGKVGEPLTFTATVSPLTAVQPISYTWWLADLPPVFQTNGISDTLNAAWSTPGTKNISVTAANNYGTVTAYHSFEIVEQKLLFLPLVAKPACEQHTAALTLDYEPTAVSVNDPLTITVTLENVGCANIGLPKYTLTAAPPLVDPAAPEPIIHYLGLGPGDSDSVEFVVTAVSPGSFTLNANASFEVHLGYPGPAYWGAAAASQQITINP